MSSSTESADSLRFLFDTHFTALVRYAVARVGDVHLAEDLVADCFVRALGHRDRVTITPGWLYRTTHNLIGDTYRRRERERRLFNTLSLGAAESYLDQDAEVPVALSGLSATDRELLLLLIVDRLPVTEVAALLGLSVAAVWKRSSRAKLRLLAALVPAGPEPHTDTSSPSARN